MPGNKTEEKVKDEVAMSILSSARACTLQLRNSTSGTIFLKYFSSFQYLSARFISNSVWAALILLCQIQFAETALVQLQTAHFFKISLGEQGKAWENADTGTKQTSAMTNHD